jgi:hypothetical protein
MQFCSKCLKFTYLPTGSNTSRIVVHVCNAVLKVKIPGQSNRIDQTPWRTITIFLLLYKTFGITNQFGLLSSHTIGWVNIIVTLALGIIHTLQRILGISIPA